MADFSCAMDIPDQPGLKANDLTVGRTFILHCKGPWPGGADPLTFKPVLGPQEPYHLKFLSAAVKPDGVDFEATAYMAGPGKYDNLVVTDGKQKIELGTVQFEVRSMLDPKANPPQEPYGAFGPFMMGIPTGWWIGGGVVVALIIAAVVLRVLKVTQRRKVLKEVAEYDSAMTPSAEFHTRMRRLQREHAIFAGAKSTQHENQKLVGMIDRNFRVYFMRRFRVPALQWSDRAVMAEFTREFPSIAADMASGISKLLHELQLAKVSDKIADKDVLQLTEASRKLTEKMDHELNVLEASRRKS